MSKIEVTLTGEGLDKPQRVVGHGDPAKIIKAVYALMPDGETPLSLTDILHDARACGLDELGFTGLDERMEALKFEPFDDVKITPPVLGASQCFFDGDVTAFERLNCDPRIKKAFDEFPSVQFFTADAELSRRLLAGALAALVSRQTMRVVLDEDGKARIAFEGELPKAYWSLRQIADGEK